MIKSEDLAEQMDVLQKVMAFVSRELRSMPHKERKDDPRSRALLDDLYEVLDRHGYHGIVKLVGDLEPERSDGGGPGCILDSKGDFYIFRK